MKVLLLIFFLCLTNILIGQDNKPTDISGIGEIRFDRTLVQSKEWLGKEILFDSSCGSIDKNKQFVNPCLRTFHIKKHIKGISWEEAYAIYYKDTLYQISIYTDILNNKIEKLFNIKYGSPTTTDAISEKNPNCIEEDHTYTSNWKFKNTSAYNRKSFSCQLYKVHNYFEIKRDIKLPKNQYFSGFIDDCDRKVKERVRERCNKELLKKF